MPRLVLKRQAVCIYTDNGSGFISKSLANWAYAHGVTMDFSRPEYPQITRLLSHLTVASGLSPEDAVFLSLEDTPEKPDNWRREYNHKRKHSSLNNTTSAEFIRSPQTEESH